MTNNILQVEGLGIDPFLIEVNSAVGSVVNKTIRLSNTTNEPLSFVASINDFVPSEKTGQALFLDPDKESNPKFTLSKWITVTKQPDFTIPAHGSTEIQFSINIPADAEPGTHYGGILFGRPASQQQTNTSTSVQQKVGAIILVKLGNSQEDVQSLNFSVENRINNQTTVEFSSILENEGNVHSKPKGDISIKNIFGHTIAQVPINRDASVILPGSKRDFSASWQPHFEFGYFSAEEVLYYGSPKLEIRAQTSFWVLPVKELIYGVPILLVSGIMLYIAIKRYNRYIIKKSLTK